MDIPIEISKELSTMGNFPSCDLDEMYASKNQMNNPSPQKTHFLNHKQNIVFLNSLNQQNFKKKPSIKKLISENISSERTETVLDPTIREIPLTNSNPASS